MEGGDRLSEAVAQATWEQEMSNKNWEKIRDQYAQLDSLLATLTDKRVHKCMVPISKVAFCPGQLVHTNDITVLLGDNYFADVSAKVARRLVEHRLNILDENIVKGKQATELVAQRKDKLNEVEDDLIKEAVTEEDEKLFVKERVARKTNEQIMAELQEKLNRTRLRTDDEVWNDIQQKDTNKLNKIVTVQQTGTETKQTDISTPRHVHFTTNSDDSSTDEETEPALKIKFKFSDNSPAPVFQNDGTFNSPWDIYNNYRKCREQKKTILKHIPTAVRLAEDTMPMSGDSGLILDSKIRIPPKRTKTAFVTDVQERLPDTSNEMVQIPTKRTSLFKQRRMRK